MPDHLAMSDLLAPRVTAAAAAILGRTGFDRHPAFVALDADLPLPAFRLAQEQFYYAVVFFARPMAALVGRIPDPHRRLDILRNLVEEHGGFSADAFHESTFRVFLQSIGARDPVAVDLPLWPCVRAFNSVLSAACVLDEVEVGLGVMGMIEYAFAGISGRIGRGVVRRGWVPGDRLCHYSVHSELDPRHAAEFFALLEPAWGGPRQYWIEQGLELGAHAFDRLYRDLHQRSLAPA